MGIQNTQANTESDVVESGDNYDPMIDAWTQLQEAWEQLQDNSQIDEELIAVAATDDSTAGSRLDVIQDEYRRAEELLNELDIGNPSMTIRQRLDDLIGLKANFWPPRFSLEMEFDATHEMLSQNNARRLADKDLRMKVAACLSLLIRKHIYPKP